MVSAKEVRARIAAKAVQQTSAIRGRGHRYSGDYVVGRANELRQGSYREHMLRHAQRHTNVEKANAAYAKTDYGKAGYKIAWRFLEENGYVIFPA